MHNDPLFYQLENKTQISKQNALTALKEVQCLNNRSIDNVKYQCNCYHNINSLVLQKTLSDPMKIEH